MNFAKALNYAASEFKLVGIESANIDARLLLAYITGKSPEYLLLNSEHYLSKSEYDSFLKVVDLRRVLRPIAYILGRKEFYGREFTLNEKVLIPRPDTELLIDAVLNTNFNKAPRILELGIGSGCIVITLLLELEKAIAIGCDISDSAINCADQNAQIYKVSNRLGLIKSDWFKNIINQKFDIIISNPPYIPLHDKKLMARETLVFEPADAPFASDNGLEAYKIIAQNSRLHLKENGKLFLEVGFNQAEEVTKIFALNSYSLNKQFRDIAGYIRVLCFELCDQKTLKT